MTISASELRSRLALGIGGLGVALLLCEGILWVYEDQLIAGQLDAMGIARPGDSDRNVNQAWAPDGSSPLHVRSDDPELVYEMRRDTEVTVASMGWTVQTNSEGFRDDPFLAEPTPGVVRIAAVGDSVTLGFWVEQAQSWPEQLQAFLSQPPEGSTVLPCPVEVMNFSVTGYDLGQEVQLVTTRVLGFRPDLLVLANTSNDEELGADAGLWRHFTRSPSRTWDFFSLRWMRMRREGLEDPTTPRFERLKQVLAADKTPILVTLFPDLDPGLWKHDQTRRDRIAQSARDQGFDVLDLGGAFEENGGGALGIDTVHPTAQGHRLAAEQIGAKLLSSGLLACSGLDPG